MTPNTFSLLDQTELRQLALNASEANDNGTAIAYLKEGASRPDCDGVTHYLLGAHYAQIKLYDRALAAMEAALALDPGLTIARFQLGLLWLTSGHAANALTVLDPLQELPETDAMRHFGQGLCHVAKDQLADAIQALNKGIELNVTNPPLNVDMQMMIDAISTAANAPPIQAEPAKPAVPDAVPVVDDAYQRHLSMLAYAMDKDKQ